MKKIIFISVLLFISLTGCSEQPISKTTINIRVTANGTLYLNEKAVQSPVKHSVIEEILGPPSKIINRQTFKSYIWDQIGVVTINKQNGKLIKFTIKLRGHMKQKDSDPTYRFKGSLTIPTGTMQFHPKYVKTEGFGFQPFMGSKNVLIQTVGNIEIMIAGAKLKIGKPDFVSLNFKQ